MASAYFLYFISSYAQVYSVFQETNNSQYPDVQFFNSLIAVYFMIEKSHPIPTHGHILFLLCIEPYNQGACEQANIRNDRTHLSQHLVCVNNLFTWLTFYPALHWIIFQSHFLDETHLTTSFQSVTPISFSVAQLYFASSLSKVP